MSTVLNLQLITIHNDDKNILVFKYCPENNRTIATFNITTNQFESIHNQCHESDLQYLFHSFIREHFQRYHLVDENSEDDNLEDENLEDENIYDIIKIILNIPSFNPTLYMEVLYPELLIDIAENKNTLLYKSIRRNFLDLVTILLDDDRVMNIIKQYSRPTLSEMWRLNRIPMLKILIKKIPDISLKPLYDHNSIEIMMSCELYNIAITNNTELLEFLLSIPHADPSRNHNTLFKHALFIGDHELVKLLAADYRVNMFDDNYDYETIMENVNILYGTMVEDNIRINEYDIPEMAANRASTVKPPVQMLLESKMHMSTNHKKCFRVLLQSPQFVKSITLDVINTICDNFIDYEYGENKIAFMSQIDGISEKIQDYKLLIMDIISYRKTIDILLTKNHPSCADTDGIISSFINDKTKK
jgi:hypothetical protein